MSNDPISEVRATGVAYRVLGQLARPGACIETIGPAEDGTTAWRLRPVIPVPRDAEATSRPPAEAGREVKPEMFQHLRRQGWIRLDEDRWVISREGAAALRRHRAAGEAADGNEFRAQHQQHRIATAATGDQDQPHGGAARAALVNEMESPLGWLRRRRDKNGQPLISAAQFEAGERLRADFYRAHMSPRVTARWDGIATSAGTRRGAPGHGVDMADHVMAARQRVNLAVSAVGPELGGVLIDVCCHLQGLEVVEEASGFPQRSGKVVLLIALTMLARHYGLVSDAESLAPLRRRTLQWGAQDYRPTLRGPEQNGPETTAT